MAIDKKEIGKNLFTNVLTKSNTKKKICVLLTDIIIDITKYE